MARRSRKVHPGDERGQRDIDNTGDFKNRLLMGTHRHRESRLPARGVVMPFVVAARSFFSSLPLWHSFLRADTYGERPSPVTRRKTLKIKQRLLAPVRARHWSTHTLHVYNNVVGGGGRRSRRRRRRRVIIRPVVAAAAAAVVRGRRRLTTSGSCRSGTRHEYNWFCRDNDAVRSGWKL